MSDPPALADPWTRLRQATAARIGLARSGASLATAPLLAFRAAHAEARDAVHDALVAAPLLDGLAALGHPGLAVASAAPDRRAYLMRPDLGRRLADDTPLAPPPGGCDLALVIADGLSARAAQTHALPQQIGDLQRAASRDAVPKTPAAAAAEVSTRQPI